MIKKWILLTAIIGLGLGVFNFISAQEKKQIEIHPHTITSAGFANLVAEPPHQNLVVKGEFGVGVNFFYSSTCPFCAKEKEFLKGLKEKYPEIEIKEYEITKNQENQEILRSFYEKYKVPKGEQGRVPVTFTLHLLPEGEGFTPNKYFVGFNDQIAKEIESCLERCLGNGGMGSSQKIKVPLFGEIDISKMSLPVLTVVIGALDGFNPCAMWVLLFLLALLIGTRSRKRMWLVAGTFIITSGVVYYLLLAAWLNLFLLVSYVNLTRIIVGILAVAVGIWQIRTFVKYRPGVCIVTEGETKIQQKIKKGLKERAEKLAISPFTFGIFLGIVILALGVNLVEFFCSAGLPAIYTRTLTLSELSSSAYYLYLLLYTFIFMLDDLIIFSLAIITLSKISAAEKYNYWATLIGGILILIIGILLIFKPGILMFS